MGFAFLIFVLRSTHEVLVDPSSRIDDSFLLELVASLVIEGQLSDQLTSSGAEDGPTVPNVGNVALPSVEEGDDGAGARLVDLSSIGLVHVSLFALLETGPDGLFHAVGKAESQEGYFLYLEMKVWKLSFRKSSPTMPLMGISIFGKREQKISTVTLASSLWYSSHKY